MLLCAYQREHGLGSCFAPCQQNFHISKSNDGCLNRHLVSIFSFNKEAVSDRDSGFLSKPANSSRKLVGKSGGERSMAETPCSLRESELTYWSSFGVLLNGL